MSGGLAIFVKTPDWSPIKTRLADCIGTAQAEAFHGQSADAVASVALEAQALGGARVHWAVAECGAMQSETWAGLPLLAQGEGGLGERMECVYHQLLDRYGAGLLVGADSPQLRASELLRGACWLDSTTPRLLLGPASDGGFWLFGGNTPLPRAAWLEPIYSQPQTRRDFVQAMDPFGEWMQLQTLTDVDRFADFPRVRADLEALLHPTPEQLRLAHWFARVESTMQVHS